MRPVPGVQCRRRYAAKLGTNFGIILEKQVLDENAPPAVHGPKTPFRSIKGSCARYEDVLRDQGKRLTLCGIVKGCVCTSKDSKGVTLTSDY